MKLVLDSNEYINYLNIKSLSLNEVFTASNIEIQINELIVKETLKNIEEKLKGEFYRLILKSNVFLYKERLPLYLLKKYKDLGLKKGDIEIAAFCDGIDADYLITENRHFLRFKKLEKVKILNLKEFLDIEK